MDKVIKMCVGMLAVLFLATSCAKNQAAPDGGKVPVSITFAGRAGEATGTGGNQAEDGIRTLRIIVAESREDGTSGRIVYNYPCPVAADGSAHVTFELLTGNYDFYVVANEASLGYSDIASMSLDLAQLEDYILTKDPSSYVGNGGIPFSEVRKNVQVTEAGTSLGTLTLPRALSRVCLSFVNQTGSNQQITDLKIAGIKANQGYLFFHNPDNPESVAFSDLWWGESGTVQVAADENTSELQTVHTAYLYPANNSGLEKYVLTAYWNGQPRTVELVDKEGKLKDANLPRNTQVNVVVTLTANKTFEMNCTVQPWGDGGESEIIYGGEWDGVLSRTDGYNYYTDSENTYYMLSYGEGNVASELVFQLTATTPPGATWTASVSNGLDFEVVKTEDGSWASGGIDGNGVLITVRAKRPYQIGITRETELYITLTENMVNRGEQIINTARQGTALEHPGTGTHIKIRQVSPDEINKLIQQ